MTADAPRRTASVRVSLPHAIKDTLVAGAEPAIGIGRSIGFRIGFVSRRDILATDHHFAGFTILQNIPIFIHDCNFRSGGEPDCTRLALATQRVGSHLV